MQNPENVKISYFKMAGLKREFLLPSHKDCGNQNSFSGLVLVSREQKSLRLHICQLLHLPGWCQSSSGSFWEFRKPPKLNPPPNSFMHLENPGKKWLGQRPSCFFWGHWPVASQVDHRSTLLHLLHHCTPCTHGGDNCVVW